MQATSTLVLSFIVSISLCGQGLSIVSWNLKDFGQSRDDHEIELIASEIRHADIVAIQEVVAKHPGGAKAVARLADELNRTGSQWDYAVSDPTRSPSSYIAERYAFLWKKSKVSLTGGRAILLDELANRVHREPYLAHFKTKKGDIISVVNYHACTHKKTYPERQEVAAISEWLTLQKFQNIIWAGDMNLKINDRAFKYILDAGYNSVLQGEKTSLKKSCNEGNYLSRAEDNVLYRLTTLDFEAGSVIDFIEAGDCKDVSWKRTSYSDHLGVEIRVGI